MAQGHKTLKIMVVALKNWLLRHVAPGAFLERLAFSLCWAWVDVLRPQSQWVTLRKHEDAHGQSFMEQRDFPSSHSECVRLGM